MAKFRQKNFISPTFIVSAIGAGAEVLGATKGAMDGAEQTKIQQEAAEKQEELLKEQNRRLEKIQEKVRSNPQAASNIGKALQGPRESLYSYSPRQKYFGVPSSVAAKGFKGFLGNIKAVGQDIGKYLKDGRNLRSFKDASGNVQLKKVPRYTNVIGNTLAGVATGATAYGVNKVIQADRKSQGIIDTPIAPNNQPEQKAYANVGGVLKTVGNAVKEGFSSNKGMIASTAAFGTLPLVSYMSDKKKQQAQVRDTQLPEQKTYALIGNLSKTFQPLKEHFGKTILGAANKATSFGAFGRKDIGRFADYMANSKNSWSKKIGDFMTAHDKNGNVLYETIKGANGQAEKVRMANKKALLGTAGVGYVGITGAWSGGEKLVNKLGRKADPNAYAYQDNKEAQTKLDNNNYGTV